MTDALNPASRKRTAQREPGRPGFRKTTCSMRQPNPLSCSTSPASPAGQFPGFDLTVSDAEQRHRVSALVNIHANKKPARRPLTRRTAQDVRTSCPSRIPPKVQGTPTAQHPPAEPSSIVFFYGWETLVVRAVPPDLVDRRGGDLSRSVPFGSVLLLLQPGRPGRRRQPSGRLHSPHTGFWDHHGRRLPRRSDYAHSLGGHGVDLHRRPAIAARRTQA